MIAPIHSNSYTGQMEENREEEEENHELSQTGPDFLSNEQLIKFSFAYDFVATLTADLNKCVSFK